MSRPHIEFIFAQNQHWTVAKLPHRGALPVKILSRDEDTGAASLILRLPPGYAARIASSFDEELYVLGGALQLGRAVLKRDGYASIAAHAAVEWTSEAGADILLWLDVADPANAPKPGHSGLDVKDSMAMRWDRSRVPPGLEFMGLARKVLRSDPVTGAQRTFLLTTSPQNFPENWEGKTETHPCVEESFMLAGDLIGPYGAMTAGAYFWRPPEVDHGPYGSRDGSLTLIRFREGTHVNVWSEAAKPFTFDVPYRPALPDDYPAEMRRAYAGAERY